MANPWARGRPTFVRGAVVALGHQGQRERQPELEPLPDVDGPDEVCGQEVLDHGTHLVVVGVHDDHGVEGVVGPEGDVRPEVRSPVRPFGAEDSVLRGCGREPLTPEPRSAPRRDPWA